VSAAFAAVDWGTSSFRLWLLDAAGTVLAERRSDEGMAKAGSEGFAAVLSKHLDAAGAAAGTQVLICGMAGARQGWLEAPYVTVPANLDDIVAGAVPVPGQGREVRILPGLAQRGAQVSDVMRGEETQLAGALPLFASGAHLVCMPGTHSKWVEACDGVVTGFATWLTGELYSLLSTQSILRHALGGGGTAFFPASGAFRSACAEALADGGDLGPALFRIRAANLLENLAPGDAASRLSGLLIGAEIASARRRLAAADRPVILLASGALGLAYRAGLELAGSPVVSADAEEAVRAGLLAAAKRLGWAGGTPA
jgi:2-dehydro-3-deoxygalactonokinase